MGDLSPSEFQLNPLSIAEDEICGSAGLLLRKGGPLLVSGQQLAEQSLQQQQRRPLLRARAVGVAWRISSP